LNGLNEFEPMGTVAGILAPPADFRVTEKAGPD